MFEIVIYKQEKVTILILIDGFLQCDFEEYTEKEYIMSQSLF